MGRTVPSFRITLDMEKQEWKPFRAALPKKERKEFDDMWDIPRLYITACSNSVSLVPLHPIMISILFHHYKELMECMTQVEQIMMTRMRRGGIKVQGLEKKCSQQQQQPPTTPTLFDF
jgi:hypothetical protein